MMKTMLLSLRIILIAASLNLFGFQLINAQSKKSNKKSIVSYPETTYSSLQYRSIGPYRGGRSSAVTGVEGKPNLFYFGAAGGVYGRLKMVVRLMKIFQMAILEEVLGLFQFQKVIPMLSMLEEAK